MSKASVLGLLICIYGFNVSNAQVQDADDFQRSTLGNSWKVLFGGSSVGIVAGRDLGLVSGSARFGLVERHNSTYNADQYSSAVIADTRIDSMLTQVFVRRRSSDAARYGFHWDDQNGGRWQIKFDGVPTAQTRILATKPGAIPRPGDTLRIEVRGMTIRGFHNGVEILSATDTAANGISETGQPGMAFRFTIDAPAIYPAPAFASWTGGNLESNDGASTAVIVVDNSRAYQTMQGFGATTLSLVYGTKDNLSPSQRAQAIETVYGQVQLTMGQIEPGLMETPMNAGDIWNERRNDNDDPFSQNSAGFNWTYSDAMKTKLVDLAMPYGFDDFSLANKINTRGSLSFLEPFRTSQYERYLDECAEHIVVGMKHWRDVYGIEPRWVAPWNEPTSGNGEIAGATTQNIVDLVKRIGKRLADEGFGQRRLIVPGEETVQRSLEVARAILADADARRYVGAIAYHAYPYESPYSSVRQILESTGAGRPNKSQIATRNELRDLGKQYGVPLWLTEISEGPGNNDYPFGAFENLRARAIHIHDELLYADASAYYGMMAMWDRISHEEHFAGRSVDFFSESSSIALIDTDRVYISGIGYAIGHYARWVKRGAVRIDASSSDSLVQVSAFRDDRQKRMVMVLINNASGERTLSVSVKGMSVESPVIGEQSTAAARWKTLSSISPSTSTSIEIILPPASVTTIAAPLAGAAGAGMPTTAAPLTSLLIAPNPVEAAFTVRFSTDSFGPVRLTLIDLLGRELDRLYSGELGSGEHSMALGRHGFPGGTYLLRLETGGSITVRPVLFR